MDPSHVLGLLSAGVGEALLDLCGGEEEEEGRGDQ